MVPAVVAGMVLYPVLSRLSLGSRSELRTVIDKAVTFLTISGIAVALVFVACAEGIVTFLYPGGSYSEAAGPLRILGLGLPFLYVNAVFIFSLFALHLERRLLIIAAIATVLNPVANFIAIPLIGEDGAALTMSLTELAQLLWLVRAMPRDLVGRESVQVAGKATFAAVAAGVLAVAVGHASPVLTATLALAGYGLGVLGLGAVATSDLRALAALVHLPRPLVAVPEIVAESGHEEVA
jgi:O-antigen/teichoic acid export membrane protein